VAPAVGRLSISRSRLSLNEPEILVWHSGAAGIALAQPGELLSRLHFSFCIRSLSYSCPATYAGGMIDRHISWTVDLGYRQGGNASRVDMSEDWLFSVQVGDSGLAKY